MTWMSFAVQKQITKCHFRTLSGQWRNWGKMPTFYQNKNNENAYVIAQFDQFDVHSIETSVMFGMKRMDDPQWSFPVYTFDEAIAICQTINHICVPIPLKMMERIFDL